MLPEIRRYLDEVRLHLHLDPVTERHVISEFYTYFQERMEELKERGLAEKDIIRETIRFFGRARVVARLMYEAHSQGSWLEAGIGALPHFVIVGLFAFHAWHRPLLALLVFSSIVCVTFLGWWRGKPNWLYSWIGYCLLPIVIFGFISQSVMVHAFKFLFQGYEIPPNWLEVILVCAFFIVSLWLIVKTTFRVVRRDWLLASLMLVPLPIMGGWLYNVEQAGGLLRERAASIYQWDIPMTLVLSILGLMTATFIRLRPRLLKAGALVSVGAIAGTIAAATFWGGLGFFSLFIIAVGALLFLLSPALLEATVGHGKLREETWWAGDWIEHPL